MALNKWYKSLIVPANIWYKSLIVPANIWYKNLIVAPNIWYKSLIVAPNIWYESMIAVINKWYVIKVLKATGEECQDFLRVHKKYYLSNNCKFLCVLLIENLNQGCGKLFLNIFCVHNINFRMVSVLPKRLELLAEKENWLVMIWYVFLDITK